MWTDVEFTRGTHHSPNASAERPSGVTAMATYGFTCVLTRAASF